VRGMVDMSATTVIKNILEDKQKSQVELAEEINITRQNLSNKLNRDKFSAIELVEIADALEMNLILKDKDTAKEYVIDYPDELKGKSKRNMTEEQKKIAQEKSMITKAKNAKGDKKE
jgi:DNA-binding Xre family transcriptional regulator